MKKRTEYLLINLMEECAEVTQRASKAIRFGLEEVQVGQKLTNRSRLESELGDILAVITLLQEAGELGIIAPRELKIQSMNKDMDKLDKGILHTVE